MKRQLIGQVLSTKMDKTVVVGVEYFHEHPLYGKKIRRIKKYYVHDTEGIAQEGNTVEIAESRPISKTKNWTLVRVIN